MVRLLHSTVQVNLFCYLLVGFCSFTLVPRPKEKLCTGIMQGCKLYTVLQSSPKCWWRYAYSNPFCCRFKINFFWLWQRYPTANGDAYAIGTQTFSSIQLGYNLVGGSQTDKKRFKRTWKFRIFLDRSLDLIADIHWSGFHHPATLLLSGMALI